MTTIPLRIRDALNRAYGEINSQKIQRWVHNFKSGGEIIPIDDCRGGKIAIGGRMEFSGTAMDIYWRSMHPCLVETMSSQLAEVEDEIVALETEQRKNVVELVSGQLRSFVRKVYDRMVDAEVTLRSKMGVPPTTRYAPTREIHDADHWIDERMSAILQTPAVPPTQNLPSPQQRGPSEAANFWWPLLVMIVGTIIVAFLGWLGLIPGGI